MTISQFERTRHAFIPTVIAVTFICLILFITWQTLIEQQQRQFDAQSSKIKETLQNYLSVNETLMRAYQAFFDASDEVSAEEFHLFSNNILTGQPHVRMAIYAENNLQQGSAEPSSNTTTTATTTTAMNDKAFSVVYSTAKIGQGDAAPTQLTINQLLASNHIELPAQGTHIVEPAVTDKESLSYFIISPINQHKQSDQSGFVTLKISPAIILQSMHIPSLYNLRLTLSRPGRTDHPQAWTISSSPTGSSLFRYHAGTWSQHSVVSLHQQTFTLSLAHAYIFGPQQLLVLVLALITALVINILIGLTLKSRWQRSRADAANHAKSKFLAIMSHEIRTPLNGIMGMADLLQKSSLPPKQKQYVRVIVNSGKSLLNVINDVLDFSQIEAGALKLETIDFSLEQLIAELSEIYRFTSVEKNIDFTASINPNTPPFLTGDPTRLRQILLNLLSNAFKFTEQGEIILRVESETTTDGTTTGSRCHLIISVSDTGIGIRHKQRLFESFSQTSDDNYRKYGGTGLGLSICKQLIEIMDGSIDVVSELGKGSCFTIKFTLPVSQRRPAELIDLNGKKLLIIDDYDVAKRILAEQAQALGMKAVTACSASEAWQLLTGHNVDYFDFIITDLDMPHTNGIEFSKHILSHDDYRQIPLLLLTATSEMPTEQQLAELNLAYVGGKPASVQQLSDIFQHIIYKSDAIGTDITPPSATTTPALNILVAEDNPVNTHVIEAMLTKLGHTYQLVSNGEEALASYQQQHSFIDLILMDCEMPVMDGLLASESIRRYEQQQHLNPKIIIALTAHALPEFQQRCYAAGMDGFLTKPLSMDRLSATINAALSNQMMGTNTP